MKNEKGLRHLLLFATAGIVVIPLLASPFLSQAQAPVQKPSFDVISIKPSAPDNSPRVGGSPRGDRLLMTKVTLKTLLQTAYPPAPGTSRQLEIIGGPAWMDSDRFDLEAKADCGGGPIDRDRYRLMIQSLLEDRFQLKSQTESREVPIYELVVAKSGLKIKPSEDQTSLNPPGPNPPVMCGPPPTSTPSPAPRGRGAAPFDPTKMRGVTSFQYAPGSVTVIGNAVPITMLMSVVGSDSGRLVIDKTNLKELYDFNFRFSPELWSTPYNRGASPSPTGEPALPAASDPAPSIATAIQQLGLRLESTKGPVDVIVIDSVQKPSEN
jgi:uncharacterized protein (TIGR03435 family)